MAFTPNDLNPLLWLDSSDPDTITEDESGAISEWKDKSSFGRHITQSEAAQRPVYFSGVDFRNDFLVFDSVVNVRAAFFITNMIRVSADDNQVCPILGGSGIPDHYVFVWINDVSYDISIDGTGEFQGAAAANGGDKISGKNIDLGLTDGNKLYPVIWYVEWDVGQDFSAIGRLQTTGGGTYRLFGQLQEIVLLPQVPTLEQRQETEGYLAGKWRLRSKLPVDHLFKEVPVLDAGTPSQTSKVSGVVLIDEIPVERQVRAFGYDPTTHAIDGETVSQSKSLGHSNSDLATGEYTIDLLAGYGQEIFVVAFDDYGDAFTAEQALTVGDRIHPTTPNGHVLECTGAGSLPAEEPEWIVDTETAQLYGSASMIAKPFYRPMVQGPILPIAVETDPSPSYSSVILADNPVTYITFDDETADDISGNNNHAALIGNPITGNVSLVGGDNKLSVTLTGSEFIDLSSLAGTLSVQYTIEAWIKTTNDSTGVYGLALFSAHSSSYSNILRLVHNNDHLSLIKGNGPEYDGTIIINDSQSHHIALVASGTDITVYIDGQVDIVFSESIVLDSAAYISVGQEYDPTGPSDYFQGTIDEIAVYGSSLSPQAVADHYGARNLGEPAFDPATLFSNGEQGGFYDPSDLSTLFQDTAGTVPVQANGDPVKRILDKSGNGNDLVFENNGPDKLYVTGVDGEYIDFGTGNSSYRVEISATPDLYTLNLFGLITQENDASTNIFAFFNQQGRTEYGTLVLVNNDKVAAGGRDDRMTYVGVEILRVPPAFPDNRFYFAKKISNEGISLQVDDATDSAGGVTGNYNGNWSVTIGRRNIYGDLPYTGLMQGLLLIFDRETTAEEDLKIKEFFDAKKAG